MFIGVFKCEEGETPRDVLERALSDNPEYLNDCVPTGDSSTHLVTYRTKIPENCNTVTRHLKGIVVALDK